MPRFVAIPVSQGDAFYLETTEGSALIDGGRSVSGFPGLFQSTTRSAEVDILVATHNDADHANGVLGFLEAGLRCKEVWLPGRWLQVLPHVVRPWEEVVYTLADQI
jgi:beta-lactamase superfamily II metal-dependent hydrolase